MCTNEDIVVSAMSLTTDELRWLLLTNAMDSLTLPTERSPQPSAYGERQRKLSQSLAISACNKDSDSARLLNLETSLNIGPAPSRASMPTPSPSALSHTFISSSSKSSPSIESSSSWTKPKLTRSPTAPPRSSSHSSRPLSSPSQEWIYRRPNKSTSPCSTHSPISPRCHAPRTQPLSYSQPGTPTSYADHDSFPFLSTVFRQRSRSGRSVPMLKTEASRSQLVISRPFSPLPMIPSASAGTTFISEKLVPSPMRTPSMTSTASTTSTVSRPSTPNLSSLALTAHHRRSTRTFPLPSRIDQSQCSKSSLDRPLLSASCPPCKSILTRSSSMSTRGSHGATIGCSPSKSVKFVETPIVHYATGRYWNLETLDEAKATQDPSDMEMGIDVEDMDLDSDDLAHFEKNTLHELGMARDLCVTPTPDMQTGGTNGLKRLIGLKRKPSAIIKKGTTRWSPSPRRTTVSGPYALGAPQGSTLPDGTCPPTSQHSKTSLSTTASGTHLRNVSSMESVQSARSAGTRSLGSTKSTSSVRSIRAWLDKIRLPANVKMNLSAAWSDP